MALKALVCRRLTMLAKSGPVVVPAQLTEGPTFNRCMSASCRTALNLLPQQGGPVGTSAKRLLSNIEKLAEGRARVHAENPNATMHRGWHGTRRMRTQTPGKTPMSTRGSLIAKDQVAPLRASQLKGPNGAQSYAPLHIAVLVTVPGVAPIRPTSAWKKLIGSHGLRSNINVRHA